MSACAAEAVQHPLSTELHYLHAVLLLSLGRGDEAARAVRRVLYRRCDVEAWLQARTFDHLAAEATSLKAA